MFKACNFQKQVIFDDAHFQQNIGFTDTIFEAGVDFLQTSFGKEVSFRESEFKDNVFFIGNTFGDTTNFISAHFFKKISFEGSAFKQESLFLKCVTNDFLSLFQCKFNILPNFSGAMIDKINLVNTDFNLQKITYFNTIKNIQRYYILTNKEQTFTENTIIFRDSFRLFKNALIKENNLLDAANHHRIELYCKEIELESKKPKIFSRDWIDKWILKFYRHTSDHHTDLLKIWHSLLIVVGIFGILSSGVIVAFDYGYLKFCDFSAHSLIEMYNAHINHFVLTHSYQMLGMNALLFMLFIGLFILSVLWDRARVIGICISYCVMIFLFAASPKYLIPAIGIFTDKRSMLDPLSVIGGIYTIVFAFMLYSFIKTARKNSIIPH